MDFVEYSQGDLITSAWANLIKDHLQDGTKGIITLSLDSGSGDIKTTGDFTDGTNAVTAAQMKSAYDGIVVPVPESKTGADCSGASGDKDRVLTLASTPSTMFLVSVGGQVIYETSDYTRSGADITFLNNVLNSMGIVVLYFT